MDARNTSHGRQVGSVRDLVENQAFRDQLVSMARQEGLTVEEAEDIIAKIQYSMLARAEKGEQIRDPQAYLIRSFQWEAQRVRRERRRFCEVTDEMVDGAEGTNPELELARKELSLVLDTILSGLEPRQQRVLVLWQAGWSYQEIADYLKVPRATVGVWRFRAMQQLRQEALRLGLYEYLLGF